MFRTYHNSSGSSKHAGNPVRRWRTVFMDLLLALAIGSAGQTVPAQAQAEVGEYYYLVDVIKPPYHFCVGQSKELLVRILESGTIGPNEPIENASIDLGQGANIAGVSADSSVVDFTGARTMLINSPSPSLVRAGVAAFTVKAKKAGATTITFNAEVAGIGATFQAQPFEVPVVVENCPVDVLAISRFSKGYVGGTIKFLAVTDQGKMTANEITGVYSGTATVYWIASSVIPGCSPTDTLGVGKVTMSGTVDKNSGELYVHLSYDPVNFTEVIPCPGLPGAGGSTGQVSATALGVTVSGSGGVSTQAQVVKGEGQSIVGSATVYVFPSQ